MATLNNKDKGKSKDSNISFDDISGKVSTIGSGITGIFGSVNSLATPQGGKLLDNIKNQAVSLNRAKVGGSMDNIYSTAMNFTPLKTSYGWKDFYANGGYLDNPYYYDPYTYDAGGRMATGILGSTASGATAGATFGPWGAAIGGAVGLIGGLLGANSGKRKAKRMANQANAASELANEGMQMKIDNAIDDAKMTQLIGYENAKPYAFGGALDGAIGYGLMTDYLNMRNKQATNKSTPVANMGNSFMKEMPTMTVFDTTNSFANGGGIHIAKSKEGTYKAAADRRGISMSELADRIKANPENYSPALRKKANFYNNFARHKKSDGGNLLIGNNGDTLFALGGILQTNGTEWGQDGLKEINAGKSHEENPYQGVQMGVAPDGSPNLVEEGETIFDDEDYVFSNRIHPKKEVLKKFHMYSKGGKLTYADVSKRLEKEAKERPNDPISKASLKDMLTMLMDAQEQQKAEEEAKEAKKAFEALSPEEQQQVLQQIAQQQQAQANAEQQANSQEEQEVPVDENGNPIEQTEEMPNQEDIAQNDEGSMNAYGGSLHKFPDGGSFKDKLISALGFSTLSDFNKWAEENNVDFDDIDWDAIEKNPLSMNFDIIAKRNPALADALKNNYDFGAYTPNTNGYDLAAFAKALNGYTKSKTRGNTTGNYAIDKDFGLGNYKDIEDLENSEAYKNYTNALVNVANAAQGQKFKLNNGVLENIDGQNFSDANLQLLNTLYNTTQGTSTFDKGEPVPMFVDNGDGTYSIAKNAKGLLIGTDGKSGLRYDHKGGIFHLTPTATTRGAKVVNRVINDDGTVEDIIGDVPTAWGKAVNTYSWNDPESSYTYNYYKRPATDANGNPKNKPTLEAKHNPEWLRYTGLLGPAVGLGLWSAGVGKPGTKGLDAAMEYASQANGKADYMPIGDYLRYNPFALWDAQNKADATRLATNRAIMNNNGSVGQKMAGLIANDNNYYTGLGNLVRTAQEYNNNDENRVKTFNRGTNMFNADAYIKTSQTNAKLQNENAQFRANLAAQIANQKMNADSQWYNALYGNIGSLFQGIGDLGRENAQHNVIADMAANSLFGTMNPDTPIAKGQNLLRYVDADGNTVDKNGNIIKKKAKGGKLKRRKGLTF